MAPLQRCRAQLDRPVLQSICEESTPRKAIHSPGELRSPTNPARVSNFFQKVNKNLVRPRVSDQHVGAFGAVVYTYY